MTTQARRFIEPSEGAFSIEVPEGWSAQAGVLRFGSDAKPWYRVQSPGGGAELRAVDPRWPQTFLEIPFGFMGFPFPGAVPRPYVPAVAFAEEYARAFANERGARQLVVTARKSAAELMADDPRPDARARVDAMLRMGAELAGVEVRCPDAGLCGRVDVLTLRMHGPAGLVWSPWITAMTAPADAWPHALATMLHIARSYRANPAWQQGQTRLQNAQHEAAMESIRTNGEILRMQGQSGMEAIRAHAQRAAISAEGFAAAGDAQMQGWRAQQGSIDESHRRAVNAVRDEVDLYDGATGTVLRGAPAGFDGYWTDGDVVVASKGHESPDPTRMRPLEDLDARRRGG